MTKVQGKVTRFSADLVAAAAYEGPRQSRSASQQLDYWVRVGRAVTSVESAERTKVEAVLAGRAPWSGLTPQEAAVVNAEISATIEAGVAKLDLAAEHAAEGVTTVALDEQGRLVEYRPDGTSSVLAEV
jgi:hypothetical protein